MSRARRLHAGRYDRKWQRRAGTGCGGTAQEIVTAGKLEPTWHFTAVDPSQPMLDLAITKLHEHELAERTRIHLGYVDDLPRDEQFDAATLIGVLHHVPGDVAKQALLHSIASRLKPQAPFILASNHFAYASQPLLLAAGGERWRMRGAAPDEVQRKLNTILQGADLPHSEEAHSSSQTRVRPTAALHCQPVLGAHG